MLSGTTDRRTAVYDRYKRDWGIRSKGYSTATGGAGGSVIEVTNLNASGAGSLRAAMETSGARIIVFEVGGVIDMGDAEITFTNADCTIAGQTAPPPGITIIKSGWTIKAANWIVSHLRFRAGNARTPLWFQTNGNNCIVDHCSVSWSSSLNLSWAGVYNTGTYANMKAGVAHQGTLNQCFVTEPLHGSGYGTLFADASVDMLAWGNYFAHCLTRTPHLKGGTEAVVACNVHYNNNNKYLDNTLQASDWTGDWGVATPHPASQISAINNVGRFGPDSTGSISAYFETVSQADCTYYGSGNDARNAALESIQETTVSNTLGTPYCTLTVAESPPVALPSDLRYIATEQVAAWVLRNSGARPWDRDSVDTRCIDDYSAVTGDHYANLTAVGGYPNPTPTSKDFVAADWTSDMIPLRRKALVA